MRTANRETPLVHKQFHATGTQTVSRQIYARALPVQHLCSVFFQHIIWCGPTSETACMQRRQKKII